MNQNVRIISIEILTDDLVDVTIRFNNANNYKFVYNMNKHRSQYKYIYY